MATPDAVPIANRVDGEFTAAPRHYPLQELPVAVLNYVQHQLCQRLSRDSIGKAAEQAVVTADQHEASLAGGNLRNQEVRRCVASKVLAPFSKISLLVMVSDSATTRGALKRGTCHERPSVAVRYEAVNKSTVSTASIKHNLCHPKRNGIDKGMACRKATARRKPYSR